MRLWTVQPVEVYSQIQDTGVYRCDPARISMPDYKVPYGWLVKEMTKRIGPPPDGVIYPVWAWYKWYNKREKPNLRRMRWESGSEGDKLVCLEVEIPDNEVLLSNYDTWHNVLNNWVIADTLEEMDRLENYIDSLSPEEATAFMRKNWEMVFNVTPLDNGREVGFIQATFWELRRDQIRNVRIFTAHRKKKDW